jgi:hypothetical protein
MALKDLKAFDGLRILTTEMDEIEVGHLLKVSKKLSLVCQDCGGRRFAAEAFIPAQIEILTGKHVIMTHVDYKEVVVNKVLKCVHCDCTEFVTITDLED